MGGMGDELAEEVGSIIYIWFTWQGLYGVNVEGGGGLAPSHSYAHSFSENAKLWQYFGKVFFHDTKPLEYRTVY